QPSASPYLGIHGHRNFVTTPPANAMARPEDSRRATPVVVVSLVPVSACPLQPSALVHRTRPDWTAAPHAVLVTDDANANVVLARRTSRTFAGAPRRPGPCVTPHLRNDVP